MTKSISHINNKYSLLRQRSRERKHLTHTENGHFYSTDNRRMSERDSKAMMTHAQQLPNSKSVPALHHVGNSGKK